jgi:hypothetical protein
MSVKAVASAQLAVTRWPTVSWRGLCFFGGFSLVGFYFLPAWLMAPLFFLTPVFGPLLLALAGLLAMRHSRAISNRTVHPGQLFVVFLVSCAIWFAPVTLFDIYACAGFGYATFLVVLVVLPLHLICIGMLTVGIYAHMKADGKWTLAFQSALAVIGGLLLGIALAFIRFQFVPQSHGIFLKCFAASGSALPLPGQPLDPHGQKDINEWLGDKPRSNREPVAVIGEDSIWLVRRNQQSASQVYWIERRAVATGGSEWRQEIAIAPGVTRNPIALAPGPGSSIFLVGFDVVGGNESWWVKRYDGKGAEDISWNKSFSSGTKISRAYGVRLDRAGSVYVFGESGETDRRGTFGWVRKFDPDGREQLAGWDKRFPNAGERRPTIAVVGLAINSTGNPCVLLNAFGAYSLRNFDLDGRELWQKELASVRNLSISADNNGNLFVYGMSGYPDHAWIKKFRADGGEVWEKNFALGELSSASAAGFDRAQNIYVVGYGTSPQSKASQWASSWWLKKFDANGAESTDWNKAIGEKGVNVPFAVHVSSRDELYVLGAGNGWQFSGSRLERWWY